jgi:serine/threonine protein kinase
VTYSEGEYGCLWTGPIGDERRYCVELGENGLENLGQGGEGLVFYALRTMNGVRSPVALKMFTSIGPADYARVADRCRVLEVVQHPHIMRQYETFIGPALWSDTVPDPADFDILYSVAEWITGEAFASAVELLAPAQSLEIVEQVAKAVSFLHNFTDPLAPNGIVHRDIKPSNVHIKPDGDAVLIDFGMAKPQDESEMTRGAGTFLWRAPEVLGGPGLPGKESDAWGIGALAYWVIVGEPTRLEGADAAREQILQRARELGYAEPGALARHISSLLESRPSVRPRDLDHWASILDQIQSGAHRRARNIRRGLLATLVAVLISGATVGIIDLARTSPSAAAPLTLLADSSNKSTSHIWTIPCNGERHFLRGSGVPVGSKIYAIFSNASSTSIIARESVRATKDGEFNIPWACGVSQIESSWTLVVTTPHEMLKRTVAVRGSAPISSLELATQTAVPQRYGVFTARAGSSIPFRIYGINRHGRLTGRNGRPIADEHLSQKLQSSVSSSPRGIASVEVRHGEFVLTDFSPGSVTLRISAPGLGTTVYFRFVESANTAPSGGPTTSGSRGGSKKHKDGGGSGRSTNGTVAVRWSTAHPGWITMTLDGFRPGTYSYSCEFGSGGDESFEIVVSSDRQTYDNGATCYDTIAGDTVRVTIGLARSNIITVTPTTNPGQQYAETAGSVVNTWSNYSDAGGIQGPSIAANQTVQIWCRLTGLTAADGNTWWYRIASSPWNSAYYVSADAFYNNGAISGSLIGTPFFDQNVPLCSS